MTDAEKIERMRQGGVIIVKILKELVEAVTPGIKTKQLDTLAERLCKENHVRPAFKGYRKYPATICIGPEDIVVHGIPGNRVLNDGEIVSIDFGIIFNDVYLDMARTVPVGNVSEESAGFLKTCEEALVQGCLAARVGNTVGDIGYAINSVIESGGYSVVREMVGHGVGRKLHEDPMIPGFGKKGSGDALYEGQTLAIEAIINQGSSEIEISRDDGWTSWTKDGMLSALFENTVLVSKESEILTPF